MNENISCIKIFSNDETRTGHYGTPFDNVVQKIRDVEMLTRFPPCK